MINRILDTCDSTNELLKSIFDAEIQTGSWVAAKKQLRGRGRGQHQWESLEGNLHLSIAFREVPSSILTWMPLRIALSIRSFLSELAPQEKIKIKWPNDLILENRKLGGVLCEVVSAFREGSHDLVCGIGVNINRSPESLVLKSKTICLYERVGTLFDVEKMIPNVVQNILKEYEELKMNGLSALKEEYRTYKWLNEGDEISWVVDGVKRKGKIKGLGKYGDLAVVESGSQKERHLFSEEVQRLVRQT